MFTTLRSKIIAGFGVLVAVHLVFTLWAVNQFSQQSNRSQSLASDLSFNTSILLRLSSISSAQFRTLDEMEFDQSQDRETRSYDARFRRILQQGRDRTSRERLFLNSGEYDSIQSAYELFSGALNHPEEVRDTMNSKVVDLHFKKLTRQIEAAGERIRAEVATYQTGILQENQRMLLTVSLASLIAAIFGVFSGVAYSRWALNSIDRLRSAVLAVRKGEFAQRIHITSADELGDLSFEFNRMIEELHKYQAMNLEALLLERRRSETIISSVSTPIIVLDRKNILLFINEPARRLFSIPLELDVVGEHAGSVITSGDLLEQIEMGDADENGSRKLSGFQWSVEQEGVPTYYTVSQHPLLSAEGASDANSPDGTVLVFNDVTEFKKLNRLKSELLARVSHELKTPVSSIVMATDLLRGGISGEVNDRQIDLLDGMKSDLRRLGNMINVLLESARIEHMGGVQLAGEVPVNEVLAEVLDEQAADAERKRISFSVHVNPANPGFPVEREHLHLILGNLISNALRFSPAGEEIIINIDVGPEGLKIVVADRGMGIPLSEQDKIFDRFYQVERGTGNPAGSVGLGLAMTRDLVLLYGGTISVSSYPGEGSSFRIEIPESRKSGGSDE